MVNVELTCEICGKVFLRKRGEAERSKRLGRRIFCSRKCTGIANTANLPSLEVTEKNLRRGKIPDEYSPFREYFKLIKRRTKERSEPLLLSLDDLKQQWEKQNGICPFTGWQLEIPRTSHWAECPITPRRASIDRIDSSAWYVPGNIQFVSVMANYCKHQFADQDVIDFCRAVVEYQDSLTKQQ